MIEEELAKQATSTNQADEGWAAFGEVKPRPSRPPPPRPAPPRPSPPKPTAPRVEIDYASGRNTPSVIVKAPSTESIKSWNVAEAETLIRKSNIIAIEASVQEQEEQDKEFDPFDTTDYEEVVAELKAKEVDPFDTSAHSASGPSKTELKLIEGEVLDSSGATGAEGKSNQDLLAELGEKAEGELNDSVDPFDTGFAADVLPDKGDPFDTTHLGEAALEEDPDFDPFDTTVADKVIPVRKPKVSQRSIVYIEDEDFDPETSFKVKKAKRAPPPRPQPVDPFAASFGEQEAGVQGKVLIPVTEVQALVEDKNGWVNSKDLEIKKLEEELLNDIGGPLQRSLTDDDFDPRAFAEPESEPEPEEDDPFDTSAITIA